MKNLVEKLSRDLQWQRSWRGLILLTCITVSVAVITGHWFGWPAEQGLILGTGVWLAGLLVFFFSGRFSRPAEEVIIRYLDRNFPFLEESAALLVQPPQNEMERWQKEKIEAQAAQHREKIRLPVQPIKRTLWISVSAMIVAFAGTFINTPADSTEPAIDEKSPDSGAAEISESVPEIPVLEEIRIHIQPPAHTGLQNRTEATGNASVPENSEISWAISAGGDVDKAEVRFSSSAIEMAGDGNHFEASGRADQNLIYQVALTNRDTTILSDYHAVSVIPDQKPEFLFSLPEEPRSEVTETRREVEIDVEISDDYGLGDISLHATLARGSGENVRFRDQVLPFEEISGAGTKTIHAFATLRANSLEMEPGDELYFFITAEDNHPTPQVSRSDTYFVIYRDSSETEPPAFATIAVDVLPEYFRSQRQIIIDTEKLLDEKPGISRREFEQRSNATGHDQNLLRLRYGQYLGLEDEMTLSEGDAGAADDHSHEQDGDHTDESEAESHDEDPLAEFGHNHGSAEMNTLFADSPRALLKEALDNMWSAEMYLRTNRPEEALAYEYQALELLKEVQQADRQYSRKAGYDSPPIPVDEKRLTGEYDDFAYPGSGSTSVFEDSPLSRIETAIRTGNIPVAEAADWVQQAEIPEADRLYLLNRLRRAEDEGVSEELKQELLNRLAEIHTVMVFDPAPAEYPKPGLIQEER